MKKYNVLLTRLILFTAILASGMAIGMELPQLPPQFFGDDESLSGLPSDVKKIIANKTLRLILDEAEDKPELIMAQKVNFLPKNLLALFNAPFYGFFNTTTPVIDFIILLIENGADPNIKNFKGNSVLPLLIKDFSQKTALARAPDNFFDYSGYLDSLELKIKFLSRHQINFNQLVSPQGETIAHQLIQSALIRKGIRGDYGKRVWSFFSLLRSLGLDFNTIRSIDGTACEKGQMVIDTQIDGVDPTVQKMFNEFCPNEK